MFYRRLETAIARVIAEGCCEPTIWEAKIPRSTWPKPSPITPGSARVSRVGFGAPPKQAFPDREFKTARETRELTRMFS